MVRLLICSFALLFAGCGGTRTYSLHHPPEHLPVPDRPLVTVATPGVTVLAPAGGVHEGAIAISPANPRVAVAAGIFSSRDTPATVVVYRTSDGGASWSAGSPLPLEVGDGRVTGHFDPAIAFDRTGVAYLAAVGTTNVGMRTSIVVFRSTDGGATWRGVHARPIASATQDKPWIDVDGVDGTIHLVWGEFGGSSAPGLYYVRGTGGGTQWSAVQHLAVGGWPWVSVLSGGTVAASFATDHTIEMRLSRTAGAAFDPPVRVASVRFCASALPDVGMHQVAVDESLQSTRGQLYAVYCGTVGSGHGVAFTRSTDGGAVWSEPVLVSGSADIALPSIAVDDRTGEIAVAWIDGRERGAVKSGRIYVTRSRDGGLTFDAPSAVTNPLDVDGFIGDYNQMAASGGLVLMPFSDVAGHFSVLRLGDAPPRRPSKGRRRAARS